MWHDEAADAGGDLYEQAAALPAHLREDGAEFAHGREEVAVEDGLDLLQVVALGHPPRSDADVVHQHVDPARVGDDGRDGVVE